MIIKNLLIEQTIVRTEDILVSDMCEEKIMLSIKNGKYYNLGNIGGYIWDLITPQIVVNKLINELMNEFRVEQSVCEEQVLLFLEHMLTEGLITIKN